MKSAWDIKTIQNYYQEMEHLVTAKKNPKPLHFQGLYLDRTKCILGQVNLFLISKIISKSYLFKTKEKIILQIILHFQAKCLYVHGFTSPTTLNCFSSEPQMATYIFTFPLAQESTSSFPFHLRWQFLSTHYPDLLRTDESKLTTHGKPWKQLFKN